MMIPPTLLDTDVLSNLMRGNSKAVHRTQQYLQIHQRLTFSLVTQFEVLRGLKARQASTQLVAFDRLCAANEVLAINEQTIRLASDLYADLYRRGELLPDADLLIAATALENGLVLATNNVNDFQRISHLPIDNWLV